MKSQNDLKSNQIVGRNINFVLTLCRRMPSHVFWRSMGFIRTDETFEHLMVPRSIALLSLKTLGVTTQIAHIYIVWVIPKTRLQSRRFKLGM